MERAKIEQRAPEPEFEQTDFFSTGSHMLDLALGGGWALGRAVNIVGDFSSGKTLIAIEAAANFARKFGKEQVIRYIESEAAFDESYANLIGMPKAVELVRGIKYVEDYYNDLVATLKAHQQGPSLYILDSVDALSTTTEAEAEIGKADYGTKAKILNAVFRRSISDAKEANCTLVLISQIRQNVGVVYGQQWRLGGGKSLDFYTSQRVFLKKKGKIEKKRRQGEYVIGEIVEASIKKNKLAPAHRSVDLHVLYSYGIDDEKTTLGWLKANKFPVAGFDKHEDVEKQIDSVRKNTDRAGLQQLAELLRNTASEGWQEIQNYLAPTMQKYE